MSTEETTIATTSTTPAPPTFEAPKGEMKKSVDLDPKDVLIVTDEGHHLYDERIKLKLDPAFVENIREMGVIEPIVVTKMPGSDKYVVVAGRQRVRAVTEINKGRKPESRLSIPAVVYDANEKFGYKALIAENEFRVEDTPLVRARKMDRAMRLLGMTEEEVATTFGTSKASVKNMLGLLTLIAPARHAVDSGKISLPDAYALAKIKEPEEQKKAVDSMLSASEGKTGHAKSKAKKEALAEATGKTLRPTAKVLKAFFDDVNKSGDESFREVAVPLMKWVLGLRKKPPTVPDMPEEETEEDDGEE